ncbi:hypothetical protein, partial [uncultured Roseibium sp.]|uniref:hypothetical protein n=1 Tax=uncultured Roseibium sp. TaxID=1936171 RepID=UPI0026231A97
MMLNSGKGAAAGRIRIYATRPAIGKSKGGWTTKILALTHLFAAVVFRVNSPLSPSNYATRLKT